MNLLMIEFDCNKISLCGRQEVKIQLPTNSPRQTSSSSSGRL